MSRIKIKPPTKAKRKRLAPGCLLPVATAFPAHYTALKAQVDAERRTGGH